ncbi:MAG TPA: phenylalanine--tRNA ligase subunit beta [Beijerinckiaceae bacterium]|nr:phenylalanine--tRNA ligase subunit beta [Beijerinckiaceae bacterium]
MKFTLSWLKDHLDTQASAAEIADALTRIGLEVERLDDPAERLRGFVVARVIEAKPHPNADRLQVCVVDAGGSSPVQVVCGAANARSGLKGVFSPVGTWIPGKNLVLQKGVIRGVESNGMLCSAMELELSDDHEGIIELDADAPVGVPYAEYAHVGDPVFEINLTPNRPDATGVAGIARDLAAAGLGRLKTAPVEAVTGRFPCPVGVRLDFEPGEAHLAPLFALRLVRGVRNGVSPEWMRRRLAAIGLRSINALVDITNYLTFDRGRPLHVFDAAKVKGNLLVRRARAGEEILGLDGKTHKLGADIVVIADDEGPESIAGIMGGEHSGCDDGTSDVLIESALWDPANIARSGRELNISTDARYRFERGVDPAFCLPGADLATTMVLEICGGEPSELVVAGAAPQFERRIDFPLSEVARLTGLELEPSAMAASLEKLGFGVIRQATNADHVFVSAPSWRPDIEGKADIVEEIVRLAGLDKIAPTPFPREGHGVAAAVLTPLQKRTRTARRALAARGLLEAVTWSFVSHEEAVLFGGGDRALTLANPISSELSQMRPNLTPGLLKAIARNFDRGSRDLALFEVGQVFLGDGESDQRTAAAAVRRGLAKPDGSGRRWSAQSVGVDAFDAKSDALALLGALGIPIGGMSFAAPGPAWLHPGRSAFFKMGPKATFGWFGELHPEILEAFDIQGPACGFEIVLDALPLPKAKATKARARLDLPELMPVERDFAFLVEQSVEAGELVKAVQGADKALICSVSVFDLYEGPGVPAGMKSLALSVTLQPREKTLTEAEIDAVSSRIVSEAGRRTGAQLRS